LAKAGIIVTKPKGSSSLIVAMTGSGESMLAKIDDVVKTKNADGTTS
jgi:hypothetical protein